MASVQLELEFGQGFSLEYLEVLDSLFHIDLHIASKFQSTPFLCLLYFPMSKRPLKASFFLEMGQCQPKPNHKIQALVLSGTPGSKRLGFVSNVVGI